MALDLVVANAIIAEATRAANAQQARITVAVVDLTGHLVALARMPGASPLTADISHTKAQTAVLLAGDTRDFQMAAALATAVDLPLALIPGGILLHDDEGIQMGAVGVAGAAPDVDDALGRAAAKAITLGNA